MTNHIQGEGLTAFVGSCPSCHGTGDVGGNPDYGSCPDCDGSGKQQASPAPASAKPVVRYGYHVSGVMEPLEDGEWVRLADYEQVVRERDEALICQKEIAAGSAMSAVVARIIISKNEAEFRAETAEALIVTLQAEFRPRFSPTRGRIMTETTEGLGELKECPFCNDPMQIKHGTLKHIEQGECVIGADAWDETFLAKWNRRAPASKPDEVAIKPLEWGETSYGSPEAISVAGIYRVTDAWDGGFNVNRGQVSFRGEDGRTNFPTMIAAKAAAHADYERRIRSALTSIRGE